MNQSLRQTTLEAEKSRFRAIKTGVFWGTTPINRESARLMLGAFLDNGAVRRYWDLHDAMVEAGYIPARPAPAVPDFTYRAPPAEPWTPSIDEGCAA